MKHIHSYPVVNLALSKHSPFIIILKTRQWRLSSGEWSTHQSVCAQSNAA